VNYDVKNVPAIRDVDVTVRTEGKGRAASVTVISPDRQDQTLATRTDANGIHFRVPEIRTYLIVVVNWQ
jgi:hypothetical protein